MRKMNRAELEAYREGQEFEAKLAVGRDGKGQVPESLWSSYSAMANTDGGVLLLGADELADGSLKLVGLPHAERMRRDLWNTLNNRQKLSRNLLREANVQVVECEGVTDPLLLITVPPASRQQKPVFVGRNPFDGTYVRRNEGDYGCPDDEVRRMIAEASTETRDGMVLHRFSLADLDPDSIQAYRQEVRVSKPNLPWHGLSVERYLDRIGAWRRDRETGQEGPTLAGLLMFGNEPAITEALPGYIADYQEHLGGEERWTHRVHHLDGTWSGNLYDFFRLVKPRVVQGVDASFQMRETKRIDDSDVHRAIREALVNTIIHADYDVGLASGSTGTQIVLFSRIRAARGCRWTRSTRAV